MLLGGAAIGWPCGGRAQQPKLPTIGVLVAGALGSAFWQLFREDLRKLGDIEGQTIRFEFREDEGEAIRLPGLADELVRLKVDLIVTWFTPAAIAAKQATREIPIVMAAVGDPVGSGLVESLARPGGNITGMATMGAELAGKLVELSREMLPSSHRIAALVNPSSPFSKPFLEKISLGGRATGTTIDPILVDGPDELDAAFVKLQMNRPDAVIVQPTLGDTRPAALALRYHLPAFSVFRRFVEQGGLMSYWASEADVHSRIAVYVDKILKGAKPADLPVEQPTKFELVINLQTAKALGLTIPQAIFARASEVIE